MFSSHSFIFIHISSRNILALIGVDSIFSILFFFILNFQHYFIHSVSSLSGYGFILRELINFDVNFFDVVRYFHCIDVMACNP